MTLGSSLALGLPLIVWAIALSLTLWGSWLALRHFELEAPLAHLPHALPPVSVLKPLKGADSGLRENLETFFHLDYPEFEILFSVADPDDPAAQIVRDLIALHPEIKAELIVGQVEVGANPKVNNLVFSYGRARHDWVLISDSNVRVPPDYLATLAAHL